MQCAAAATLLLLASGASALDLRGSRGAGAMRPELIAETFASVEDEWRAEATAFAECQGANATAADCSSSSQKFDQSCNTVAKAMVAGSGGKKEVIGEYMGYVCNATALQGWKRQGCYSFAQDMDAIMTADSYSNREGLNVSGLCGKFWVKFSAEEKVRVEQERAQREAEEKKRAEEAAEAAKQAAEEAKKAEELQQKADEAKKAEEAQKAAEEAKAKAEEAAQALALKKEEATKMAEEAGRKLDDAKKAAEEHARLANKTKGGNGATVAAPNATANATVAASNATANVTKNATK